MSSLFSSPSKQAQSAAQAQGQISQQQIQQIEQYVTGQQQQLRGAISGLGSNPYFDAASQMSPDAYKVDPANTTSFGQSNTPPGLSQGKPTASPSPAASNPFSPPTTRPPATQPPGPAHIPGSTSIPEPANAQGQTAAGFTAPNHYGANPSYTQDAQGMFGYNGASNIPGDAVGSVQGPFPTESSAEAYWKEHYNPDGTPKAAASSSAPAQRQAPGQRNPFAQRNVA